MITTKERATLRSFSNNIPDLVYVGKEGVSENLLKQVNDNLLAHELIKIKVQPNCEFSPKEICNQLVEKVGADPVSVIGGKIVLYKKTTKPGFKHYL